MGTKEVRKRLQHLYEKKESTMKEESKYVYTKKIDVDYWFVGMTLAYRKKPTVVQTVESLRLAGWAKPYIFAEPNSNSIDDLRATVPIHLNKEVLGNWGNFCSRLRAMLQVQTNYYLFVQDDVEFLSSTRQWLENNWPCNDGIVSLYRSARYVIDNSVEPSSKVYDILSLGHNFLGTLAVAMTRKHAESLLLNLEAMTDGSPHDDDGKLGRWAHALRIPINIVRESRCQHIGDSSSIFPSTTRVSGSRRADTYYV